MRERKIIEEKYNDCIEGIKEDSHLLSIQERSVLRSAMASELALETLLDIRDLLTPKEICVCTSELKCQFHSKKENHE